MLEIWSEKALIKENDPVRLDAEVEIGRLHYQAQIIVYPLTEPLERPSMQNAIRLYDPQTLRIVGTADDVRRLNTEASLLANVLNTYPATELIVFFPDSLSHSVNFSRELARVNLLGRVETDLLGYDLGGRTLGDGFYYCYRGTNWEKKPWRFLQWQIGGKPSREDMQFSMSRRTDYRIRASDTEEFMSRPVNDRVAHLSSSLEEFSQGEIRISVASLQPAQT